jgi:uncharacterized protein YhfF
MILSHHEIDLVLAGKKTMQRIPVPSSGLCRYKIGRLYAIQPSHRDVARLHVTILTIREDQIGNITLKHARREGHRTLAEHRAHWEEGLEGAPYNPEESVWVITFKAGDHTDKPNLLRRSAPSAPICRARIKLPDGRTVTCKRAFADKQDICKCGARRPPETAEDHGYTSISARALMREPEAIPAALQAQYARESENNLQAATNGHLETHVKRLHAVIAEIREHAKDPKANDQLRGLERQAKALERKLTA